MAAAMAANKQDPPAGVRGGRSAAGALFAADNDPNSISEAAARMLSMADGRNPGKDAITGLENIRRYDTTEARERDDDQLDHDASIFGHKSSAGARVASANITAGASRYRADQMLKGKYYDVDTRSDDNSRKLGAGAATEQRVVDAITAAKADGVIDENERFEIAALRSRGGSLSKTTKGGGRQVQSQDRQCRGSGRARHECWAQRASLLCPGRMA